MSTTSSSGSLDADRIVHEGGRNVSYDLTGLDAKFLQQVEYTYFQIGQEQEIELPFPAYCFAPAKTDAERQMGIKVVKFSDTLAVNELQAVETEIPYYDGTGEKPEDNVYWQVVSYDTTSMAKAHRLWNRADYKFNGDIVRKIKVSAGDTSVVIRISMQKFYEDMVETSSFRDNTEGPLYSRALGQFLLNKVDEIEARSAVMTRNMFGSTTNSSALLEEDLYGTSAANRVFYEWHEFDTASGKNMLAPARGSFYPGSADDGTLFEMYNYKVEQGSVTDEIVASGSKVGWMFCFTVNNVQVYTANTDIVFVRGVTYYKSDRVNGTYTALVAGTDYNVGDTVKVWEQTNGPSFLRINVPYDPSKGFDGAINDTSAFIVKEQRVLLTHDNIKDYKNYTGTFVDVSCLTLGESGGTVKLVKGTDYDFCDVNQEKTARTYSKQAVYDHIRILSASATAPDHRVGITYQAFGGNVTSKDIADLRKDITNLLGIIADSKLLTKESLGKSQVITDIVGRLRRLEVYYDHFHQIEHQVYMGGTGVKFINIATLFDVVWMDDTGTIKDVGTFRVESKEQGWCYEFTISADMSKIKDRYAYTRDTTFKAGKIYYTLDTVHNVFKTAVVEPGEDVPERTYFEKYIDAADRCFVVKTTGAVGNNDIVPDNPLAISLTPHVFLRLCWNDSELGPGRTTGLMLQLGWDFDMYKYDASTAKWDMDLVTVTNKSSHTSKWKLVNPGPLETSNYNDAVIDCYTHATFKVFVGTATLDTPYYKQLQEYTYYETDDVYVQNGVTYYKVSTESTAYVPISASELPIGTLIADYIATTGNQVYERTARRIIWNRTYVAAGTEISAEDGYFYLDNTDSYQNSSFDFPYIAGGGASETWSVLNPAVSKSVIKALDTIEGGWPVWVGGIQLKAFSAGPKTALKPIVLPLSLSKSLQRYFDIRTFVSATFHIQDNRTGRMLMRTAELCPSPAIENDDHAYGDVLFYLEDMCGLDVKFSWVYDASNDPDYIVATINCNVGTSSFINDRFVIRQIDINM